MRWQAASGAAKFLRGLVDLMDPVTLTIVSNTGDDLERFGLHISPDIDIVTYTLAGLVDEERGWGIRGDTFEALAMLQRYGEAAWFNLGDRDLATHILRTERLRTGESLTGITKSLCQALNVRSRILPMCDQAVPTLIRTPAGVFHFQEYLVQRGGREEVLEVVFQGVEQARPASRRVRGAGAGRGNSHLPEQSLLSVSARFWPCPACVKPSLTVRRRWWRSARSSPGRR